MFALLLALLILLLPAAASAAPIAFGDVVVLTGSAVVRLDAANGYAPDAPIPVTLSDPQAIDVAPDGRVYVVDDGTNSILEIAPGGSQRAFAPTGTRPWGPGGEDIDVFLVEPRDMALGRDGKLWVADQLFRLQDPDWGFDGNVVFVDPQSGGIASSVGPGTIPQRIDIGPFSGGFLKPGGPEARPLIGRFLGDLRDCDESGCDPLFLFVGEVAVQRDGRLVASGERSDAVNLLAEVFVFDSTGLLLLEFADTNVLGRLAGGIESELFFMDSPTSIARFDLETGISTPIYDAGVPILDLAVQQIPEPGALWLLAAGAALTLRRRPRGNVRRWPGP